MKIFRIVLLLFIIVGGTLPLANRSVAHATSMTHAMWVFSDVVTDPMARQLLVDHSIDSGTTDLYVSVYRSISNSSGRRMYEDTAIADLIRRAHDRGLAVWAAYGAPDWPTLGCSSAAFPLRRMAEITAYNTAHPEAAFDGVMLDIEPSTPIDEAGFQSLLALYQCIRTALPASIKLGVAIPAYWTTPIMVPGSEQRRPAYQHIVDLPLDHVVVMGYRDYAGTSCPANGIICFDTDEIAYAHSVGKDTLVLVGLETQNCAPQCGKPYVTFFEEGQTVLDNELRIVADTFAGRIGGFAIHDYKNAYLGGLPQWPTRSTPTSVISDYGATNDDLTSTFQLSYTGNPTFRRVYIDVDPGHGTGYTPPGVGADYLIENGTLYKYGGKAEEWEWDPHAAAALSTTNGTARWTVSRADLGNPERSELVFQVESPLVSSPPYTQSYYLSPIHDSRVDNTDTTTTYQFSHADTYQFSQVFIDTDQQTTGFGIEGTGAEYLVENGSLYRYIGTGTDWKWQWTQDVAPGPSTSTVSWTVSRTAIGETNPCSESTDLVFRAVGATVATSPVHTQRFLTSDDCTQQKMAVASYFRPGPFWSQLQHAAPTIGLAVINPASGPGTSRDGEYAAQITSARAQGIMVLGYVSTSYGNRSLDVVKKEIDDYYRWYPNIDGIFLDEGGNTCESHAAYYQPLYEYIKHPVPVTVRGGRAKVVLNPGSMGVPECYMTATDIMLNFEGANSTFQQQSLDATTWQRRYSANRFWQITHTTSKADLPTAIAAAKRNNAGWFYATDEIFDPGDPTSNPYDTLPTGTYWTTQQKLITDGAVGRWDSAIGQPGFNDTVYALVSDGAGSVYAGGTFTFIAPDGSHADHIARWDGNAWSAVGNGLPDGVKALAIDHRGVVYAAGGHDTGGGVLTGWVQRWDGSQWSPLKDPASTAAVELNGMVYSLAVDHQNRLVVGGDFNVVAGKPANSITRWDPRTQTWATFGTAAPFGLSGWLEAVAIGPDDTIYAGGQFGTGEEGAAPINVARWDEITHTWTAVGGGINGTVYALAVDQQGRLYGGGIFTRAGDTAVQNIARWNPGTQTWSALNGGMNDQVATLVASSDGDIYAAGRHSTTAGNVPANRIARWDSTSESWAALGSGTNNPVVALALDDRNTLSVGGAFSGVDGAPANGVAQWFPSVPPAPRTANLSPASRPQGSASFDLSVTGQFFGVSARVLWNGVPLATALVSPTNLRATVPAANLTVVGPVEITVASNDPRSTLSSNAQTFFVIETAAAITAIRTAISSSADGTATVVIGPDAAMGDGSLRATALGAGSVTIAHYSANPVTTSNPNPIFGYFDVYTGQNSQFTALTVQNCDLSGGNIVHWWNEGTSSWDKVSNQSYDPTTGCVTINLTTTTSPSLSQLGGTVFGVARYTFTGFFQPVDNNGIFNRVKAGQAIPIKFSLGGNHGLDIFASGYPASQHIKCPGSPVVDVIEETVAATANSITYAQADRRYVYVWKTDRSWAQSCRQFVLKLDNGSEYRANFTFTK